MLEMHWVFLALSLAAVKAGSSNAAKIAMMAITTSNSISVNAERVFKLVHDFGIFYWLAPETRKNSCELVGDTATAFVNKPDNQLVDHDEVVRSLMVSTLNGP